MAIKEEEYIKTIQTLEAKISGLESKMETEGKKRRSIARAMRRPSKKAEPVADTKQNFLDFIFS